MRLLHEQLEGKVVDLLRSGYSGRVLASVHRSVPYIHTYMVGLSRAAVMVMRH